MKMITLRPLSRRETYNVIFKSGYDVSDTRNFKVYADILTVIRRLKVVFRMGNTKFFFKGYED